MWRNMALMTRRRNGISFLSERNAEINRIACNDDQAGSKPTDAKTCLILSCNSDRRCMPGFRISGARRAPDSVQHPPKGWKSILPGLARLLGAFHFIQLAGRHVVHVAVDGDRFWNEGMIAEPVTSSMTACCGSAMVSHSMNSPARTRAFPTSRKPAGVRSAVSRLWSSSPG